MRFAPLVLIWLAACDSPAPPKRTSGRQEPICAVQDCRTNQIVDNGCDVNGRCASCINSCAEPEPPPVQTRDD